MQTRLFNLLPHRPTFNLWNSTWCLWDQIGGKLQKVPLQACHRSSEWENALDFFVEMQQRNLQQEPKKDHLMVVSPDVKFSPPGPSTFLAGALPLLEHV